MNFVEMHLSDAVSDDFVHGKGNVRVDAEHLA